MSECVRPGSGTKDHVERTTQRDETKKDIPLVGGLVVVLVEPKETERDLTSKCPIVT